MVAKTEWFWGKQKATTSLLGSNSNQLLIRKGLVLYLSAKMVCVESVWQNPYLNDPQLSIDTFHICEKVNHCNGTFYEWLNKMFSQGPNSTTENMTLRPRRNLCASKKWKDERKHSCTCIQMNEWVKGVKLCLPVTPTGFHASREGETGWKSGCHDRTGPAGGRGVMQRVGGDSTVSHCTQGVTSPGWEGERRRQAEGGGRKWSWRKMWEIYLKFC